MKHRIVLVVLWVVFGVPLALLLDFLGIPLPFGIAWILVFAAAVVIAQQDFVDDSGPWPPPPPEHLERGSDVSRLAWAIDARTGVVGVGLRRRVQALVERRLRAHGVPPEQAGADAVDRILGSGSYAALAAAEMRRPELERILRALEHSPAPARAPVDRENGETA